MLQVIYAGEESETVSSESERRSESKHPTARFEKCPECGSPNLNYQEGCVRCLDCGWTSCLIT